MPYVYREEDNTILAVSLNNILSFGSSVRVTFVQYLPDNVDWTFYKMSDTGVFSENVQAMKDYKLYEMSDSFEKAMAVNSFMTSFGFEVDNRRSGTKNDKDNVNSLITLALANIASQTPDGSVPDEMLDLVSFQFRGTNSVHELTVRQLQSLELQMIENGFSVYQHKWTLEARIQAGTSNAEIQAIKW